jgi:Mlc titration factor MtfA (ptsG expression regulator)
MFAALRRWRQRRILERERIDDALWQDAVDAVPAARHLDAGERERLRELATLFLHEKSIESVHGLALTSAMRVRIAAEAVVPVLNLDLSLYDGWYTVIVYPDEFVAPHEYVDEAGVHHSVRDIRTGEAWERGPVLVSWHDIDAGDPEVSVIIHEMAHKLDQRDGSANGCPPLHRGMDAQRWREVFSRAYESLCAAVDAGEDTWIDPYAAEDPGEFFAVVSELFFTAPAGLRAGLPDVYGQLSLYYRQDPADSAAHS